MDAGVALRLGAAVSGADAGVVELKDGARADEFDLIVAALGAKSPLTPLRAKELPYGALWANVTWPAGTDLPMDELRQKYRKASNMLGVLPIGTPPGASAPIN